MLTADLDATWVEPGSLEISISHQRYEYLGEEERSTPVGRFHSARWRYTNLDSGWSSEIWIAGAVVVSYPEVAELASYEPLAAGPFPQ